MADLDCRNTSGNLRQFNPSVLGLSALSGADQGNSRKGKQGAQTHTPLALAAGGFPKQKQTPSRVDRHGKLGEGNPHSQTEVIQRKEVAEVGRVP